jgi:transglutaminase-like putative cysteine protease
MKSYIIFGVCSIIILVILTITVIVAFFWFPAKIHYRINLSFLVTMNGETTDIYLGILVPKNGPYQTVKNLNIVWNGNQVMNALAYVDTIKLWDRISGKHDLESVVEYDVALTQGKTSWEAPVEYHLLLPQIGIESDHAEIKQIVNQIAVDTAYQNPYEIFKFTSNHLDYSETGCEQSNVSALEAYRSGIGSCIGYSRLMVAICRASGIPAKMIIGNVLPDLFFPFPRVVSSSIPGGGHAWVEYYYDDNWYMADPSWAHNYPPLSLFNRNDGHHLSFGEFYQFTAVRRDLADWATQTASPLDEGLTHIFTSSSEQIRITSETSIRKTWDGRWINTILSLAVVTYLLCMIRDRLIFRSIDKGYHSI